MNAPVWLLAANPSDIVAARQQMAFTLGTHIVLASLGVSFPAMMLIANYRGLKKGDDDSLKLAQRWSKANAVLFAVGAVTGTVLSFEMGLLWPGMLGTYGPAFGIPFAIEGLFFFTEAIFIAIYLYGWKRLSPWAHFWSGVPIVVAGFGGAFAVVTANAWMNQPSGYTLDASGKIASVQPLEVIFNKATPYQTTHMILAAYVVGGFLIASVYAVGLLRGRRDRYTRLGFLIPFTVGCLTIIPQMIVGDSTARAVSKDQPIKFAAIELVPQTSTNVPETVGGVLVDGQVKYGIPIPDLGSILTGFSPDTQITGLDTVPASEQPPASVVHLSFDVMVFAGSALVLLALWFFFVWWRKRDLPKTKWFLRAAVCAGALAILALESGWIVTEVGRQPWIVYNVMKTSDAATDATGIWYSFVSVVVLYSVVGYTAIRVLWAMSKRWRAEDEADGTELPLERVPYGPREGVEHHG
ncbi:MAG: cytochrome ubiquinol oxidase subunit I [Actinobacteria bacterium]|nr:cytochrome ubiquinol oxidase subunit I [Actinomycetota bacterium]